MVDEPNTTRSVAELPVGTPGGMLALIRSGAATTRTDLARATGLARSTVANRLEQLHAVGLLRDAGDAPSTGGRPAARLAFNSDAGVVLAIDLGATQARLGVCDLAGHPLVTTEDACDIAEGPDDVIAWAAGRLDQLLVDVGRSTADIWGVGVGVPGPVEFSAGRAVSPPIMPGWDGVDIRALVRKHFDVPVMVDNDVNIMAVGEYHAVYRDEVDDLLLVKVGTGIGCGIIGRRQLQRGAHGAAGDLGHVHIPGRDEACRCGNIGCLEAIAGGGALAERLRARGHADTRTAADVLALVRAGEAEAVRLVREAGRLLGESLAVAVNLLNPPVIVLAGSMADEQLMAGVREIVYQRSLPLATRHLRIVRSALGADAGVIGAATMLTEMLLSPVTVDSHIAALPLEAS